MSCIPVKMVFWGKKSHQVRDSVDGIKSAKDNMVDCKVIFFSVLEFILYDNMITCFTGITNVY